MSKRNPHKVSFFPAGLDEYLASLCPPETPAMQWVREYNEEQVDDPLIARFPIEHHQGHLLAVEMLEAAREHKVEMADRPFRILEIGTYLGYSTQWLAYYLPKMLGEHGWQIDTFEMNEQFADIAREGFERAGLGHKIKVHVGRALDELTKAKFENDSFDAAFIDADKSGYWGYAEESHRVLAPDKKAYFDNVFLMLQPLRPREELEALGESGKDFLAIQVFNEMMRTSKKWLSHPLTPNDGMTKAIAIKPDGRYGRALSL